MQQLKLMVSVLIGSLFFMAVFLLMVHGHADDAWQPPQPLWLGILAVVVVGSVAFARLAGFTVPALELSDHPHAPATRAKALAALQASTIRRFAATEAIAIIGVVLSFLATDGGALFLVFTGLALCLGLMLWQVWPTAANLRRVEASLNRNGASFSFTQPDASGRGTIPGMTQL